MVTAYSVLLFWFQTQVDIWSNPNPDPPCAYGLRVDESRFSMADIWRSFPTGLLHYANAGPRDIFLEEADEQLG